MWVKDLSRIVIHMSDLTDHSPKRHFLPKVSEMRSFIKTSDNSSIDQMIKKTLIDCERRPEQGKSKRCLSSIEDIIDFNVFLLGRYIVIVARTTQNENGPKKDVMLGRVTKVSVGKVTRSITYHQEMFPPPRLLPS
ncbi:polygalacturonase 1 beta protein [Trifolium repens]|nr:polygalacturonase 1 beta protein [Trifolium repens]